MDAIQMKEGVRRPQVRSGARKWLMLAALLLLVFIVATVGSAFTTPKIPGWYAGLNKPFFNPPSWVFGPVWTVLYAAMAFAAWRVWLSPDGTLRSVALAWFFVQLLLNALWSPVFFGMESPGIGLVIIIALLTALGMTVRSFFAVDRFAGWNMVPYLAWVAFASLLNGAILLMN
jgi:benzodiazapine receptor